MNFFARPSRPARLTPVTSFAGRTSPSLFAGLFAGLVAGLVAFGAVSLHAPVVQACGGTFCAAGPTAMPVDQTGENILFIREGAEIEAHIQIQYTGDAAEFAWVIPVSAPPVISVGSQALFDNLLAATVPTFTLSTVFEDSCGGGGGFCGDDSAAFSSEDVNGSGTFTSGTFTGGETGADSGGPIVVDRGVAGAFEFTVLEGGTVEGLVAWLDTNGYQQDDEAPEILQEYLNEQQLFVAVKLRSGAGIEEIQPLVIRYEGSEPCIPIRLTKIAAKQDMGIRAFFLGDARVVPQNYAHVLLNLAAIDWLGDLGGNYEEIVTLAVDEDGAQGHAFVTEYAGASDVVGQVGLFSNQWRASAFESLAPDKVIEQLAQQDLLSFCGPQECVFTHPMVDGLLATYLPVPAGLDAGEFYGNLALYSDQIDLEIWNGPAFAADFSTRIVAPGARAVELLGDHAYLTRLYTTLSPNEMNKDPMFHTNTELGEVSNTHAAILHTECENKNSWLELPDARIIGLDDQGNAPTFDDMPRALRFEQVPMMGAAQVIADFDAEISKTIALWNRQNPSGALPGCACDSERNSPQGAIWLALGLCFGFGQRRLRSNRSS